MLPHHFRDRSKISHNKLFHQWIIDVKKMTQLLRHNE